VLSTKLYPVSEDIGKLKKHNTRRSGNFYFDATSDVIQLIGIRSAELHFSWLLHDAHLPAGTIAPPVWGTRLFVFLPRFPSEPIPFRGPPADEGELRDHACLPKRRIGYPKHDNSGSTF